MRLNIVFDGGESTCASKPGKFCRWCRTDMYGRVSCQIFGSLATSEPDGRGWVLRHEDCLSSQDHMYDNEVIKKTKTGGKSLQAQRKNRHDDVY